MDDKYAITFLVGQHHEWWVDRFYVPFIESLYDTGLYDKLEFIDINICGGNEPLPFILDKTRHISYRRKSPIEMNEQLMDLHDFCSEHSGYKVLWFHTDGVTHYGKETQDFKLSNYDFLKWSLIDQWKIMTRMLDFYDCAGVNWTEIASFHDPDGTTGEFKNSFYAPHYRSGLWWANSDYIASMNKNFLKRKVFWNRFLGEVWIGTGKPRHYTLHNAYSKDPEKPWLASFYNEMTEYNPEQIVKDATEHINYLSNVDIEQTLKNKLMLNHKSKSDKINFEKWL